MKKIMAAIARTSRATPTPIPASAPVLRVLDLLEIAVEELEEFVCVGCDDRVDDPVVGVVSVDEVLPDEAALEVATDERTDVFVPGARCWLLTMATPLVRSLRSAGAGA